LLVRGTEFRQITGTLKHAKRIIKKILRHNTEKESAMLAHVILQEETGRKRETFIETSPLINRINSWKVEREKKNSRHCCHGCLKQQKNKEKVLITLFLCVGNHSSIIF
jgi:hypothetical protein